MSVEKEKVKKKDKNMTKTIEYNRIIVRKDDGNSLIECDKCKRLGRIKSMSKYKGKVLCSHCKPHIIRAKDCYSYKNELKGGVK